MKEQKEKIEEEERVGDDRKILATLNIIKKISRQEKEQKQC